MLIRQSTIPHVKKFTRCGNIKFRPQGDLSELQYKYSDMWQQGMRSTRAETS